jgi:hypothetical protein
MGAKQGIDPRTEADVTRAGLVEYGIPPIGLAFEHVHED